ncbi:hypothetical protein DJ480_00290 [Pseudomonas sp. Leaf98]|nr:hypothetical protein DJ480_00290 [Pseudomonas sp. Leaf98]
MPEGPSPPRRLGSRKPPLKRLVSNAIWGDRRSTTTDVEPLVRLPESTATMSYLGLFNSI